MATMNISLPDEMKDWVDGQVATGQYAGASDYLRDLIRKDQEAVAELQALVDEGLNSGISDKTLDEIFADARRGAVAHIQALAAEAAKDDAA